MWVCQRRECEFGQGKNKKESEGMREDTEEFRECLGSLSKEVADSQISYSIKKMRKKAKESERRMKESEGR